MPIVISGLSIYPIKSCAGIALDTMLLDELGATYDRRYMLVDEQGQFITQRQYARLVHVDIESHQQGWLISLPGVGAKVLPLEGSTLQTMKVTVWSDTFPAYDQGDEWAALFSSFLGKKVRLVFSSVNTARRIDAQYSREARPVSFADGFPLLLANESSLAVLNNALENPVDMLRFRPNIIVRGAPAFAENQWQVVHTQNVGLAVVKPCSRCVIPTINPQTAQKQPAIWRVLELFCKASDGKVYFGQNVIHQSNGVLTVGDTLFCQ